MANRRGNPKIAEAGRKTRFTSENAVENAVKSNQKQAAKRNTFASAQGMIDLPASEEYLTPSVVKFWADRNVPKENITPMLAEITPIYADAIRNRDLATLERIYRLLGLTFDCRREHNINLSLGNADDKPFEINYIVNGKKVPEDELED